MLPTLSYFDVSFSLPSTRPSILDKQDEKIISLGRVVKDGSVTDRPTGLEDIAMDDDGSAEIKRRQIVRSRQVGCRCCGLQLHGRTLLCTLSVTRYDRTGTAPYPVLRSLSRSKSIILVRLRGWTTIWRCRPVNLVVDERQQA